MKVFLDANILFSSSAEKTRVRELVLIIQKHGVCVTNSYAINEAKKILLLKNTAIFKYWNYYLKT